MKKENAMAILATRNAQILEVWMKNQLKDHTLREDLMSNDELRSQSEEFLSTFLQTIKTGATDIESMAFDNVREILAGISMSRARQGFSPRETGTYIFSLKEAILDVLQQETGISPELLFTEAMKVNRMLDSLGVMTFETFIKGREEVIIRQMDEIAEISTPVIRVWDGVVAMPIIGTLDSSRTQVVMENLLQEIVNSGSGIAILDISGVPAVDSLVAQHLIKTVSATRLMGAECIISGIRPEIAQTVVHLGIDLSTVVTKATLASALKHAFGLLKLQVKRAESQHSK
ncbi:MAG: STAS domain-containing protein [Bacteroidota bacterium]